MYCLYNGEYGEHDLSHIGGLESIVKRQKEAYQKYIGTIVGDFTVLEIEYDWGKRNQRYKVKCNHCGEESFVLHASDWRRGKGKSTSCHCQKIKNNSDKHLESSQPKQTKLDYTDSEWVGKEYNGYRIKEYYYRGRFLVECVVCGKERKIRCGELINGKSTPCKHKTQNDYSLSDWIGKKNGHLTALSYEGTYFQAQCDCGRIARVKGTELFGYKNKTSCGHSECQYYTKHRNAQCNENRIDGIRYEHKAVELFEKSGFQCERTPDVGDFGVDFIVHLENGDKIAIQCKKHKKPAGVKAVQQVFAGGIFYDCNKFAIISATGFTENAITMAAKLGVYLPLHHFELSELYNITDYTMKLVQTFPTVECIKGTRLRTKWTVNGETKLADDWCKEYGISRECVNRRLSKGMSIEDALSLPRYNTKVYQIGDKRGSLSELCQIYGMIPETVKYRINYKGMTIEEALLTPLSQVHSNSAKGECR